MDDTYIIHENKEFLKELYKEYQAIAGKLGITINSKKTQIMKLEKGFIFLQMRYVIASSGKIKVIPVNKTIVRQRRKLKKFYRFLIQHRITQEQIHEQYKSWRGNIAKFNSYKSICKTDELYNNLFGGKRNEKQNGKNIRRKTRRSRKHPSGDWFSCLGLRFSS